VLVAGEFQGTVSFDGASIAADATGRAFLARFGNDGSARAMQAIGTSSPGASVASRVATTGALTVVQTLEWGTAGLPDATGGLHAFDDSGAERWSVRIADDGDQNPQLRSLAITPDDRVLSAAWVDAPYNDDHPDQTSGGMEVSTFDASGNASVSAFGRRMIGAPKATMVQGSAVGPSGEAAFAGEFAGALELGPAQLATAGDTDVFVVVVDRQQ
jgi:hypothetical protein